MNRREFIKFLGVLGVSSTLPLGTGFAFASSMTTLPVPGLLRPDTNGRIRLSIGEGTSTWKAVPTRTWGYNGPLLGPALSLRRGQTVSMEITNNLPESTAVHWHGLEVPGTSDGGPQELIESGASWRPELTVDQKAATCWFHPHPHGKTGRHVAMGLGGLLIIEDDESAALPLPNTWGVDDIPVILQDKRLGADSQIAYTMDVVNAAVGWFGDMLLTNGAIYPVHAAPKGWLRLRLLNGCNARSLRLACSDKRPMYVIASDGGFLAEPVKLSELMIYPSERFEVLVEVGDGSPFDLITLPVKQVGMTLPPFDKPFPALRITSTGNQGHKVLPDTLVTLPSLPKLADIPVRKFKLSMDPRLDMQGMHGLMQRYGMQAMAGMEGHMMGGMSSGDMMDGNSKDGAMQHGMGGMMHDNSQDRSMQHGMGSMMHGNSQDGSMQHRMEGMSSGNMMHGSEDSMQQGTFDLWNSNMINGKAFAMNTASFDVKRGQYERWIISGVGDMMLHPFHIHGTQFRILKENGATPPAHRKGRKDVAFVDGGESEVLVRFMHSAPPERMYMAHCHLLEHEDTGMMLSFTVTP